jgi:hypothetical protein
LISKKGLLFLIFGLILFFSTPLTQGASKVEFRIVYTNDVMGEVEPCG